MSPIFVWDRKASVTEQPERPEEARLWFLFDRHNWQHSHVQHVWTIHEVLLESIHHYWTRISRASVSLLVSWGDIGIFGTGYLRRWFSPYWSMKDSTHGWAFKVHLGACKPQRCPQPSTCNTYSPTLFRNVNLGFRTVPSSQLDHASPLILPQAVQDRQSRETSSLRTITKKDFDVVLSIIPYRSPLK